MARRRTKIAKPNISDATSLNAKRFPGGLIVSIIVTLILGGIPFGMGKYIELNSPGPFDSGAFVYSAEHLLDGAKLGVDTNSSARPNTLLANVVGVAVFGFSETGPKLIQMLLQLGGLGFMFYTLRKVFGSTASVVGTTVAAIYLSAPLIAKFGNVKEQFMIPFMIAAACGFILYRQTQKRHWLILSGFFSLQPYYFKPTGLSIVIAIVVFIAVSGLHRKAFMQMIIEFGLFAVGFAAGLLVPGTLYFWQGNPMGLLQTLPVVMLQAGGGFAGLILILSAIVIGVKRVKLLTQLRQVSKWVWISGVCILAVTLIISIGLVGAASGFDSDDITSYIRSIPIVSAPAKLLRLIDLQFDKLLTASGLAGGYVSNSWKAISLSKLAPQIFRYYKALSVPILPALASMITVAAIRLSSRIRKPQSPPGDIQSNVVWLLAIWWMLDMAFVWGSPRSYEQYYLPLCASGAMLGGFVIWKWQKHFTLSHNKMPWLAGGAAVAVTLGCLSIPIFIGQRYSPDTGTDYVKNYGQRRRGFGPSLKELPGRNKNAWTALADTIKARTTESDTIYVWGWYPGIYVRAQRLAPVSRAFYSDMHVTPPPQFAGMINQLVEQMKENPPKFIVDSRKMHFPNDRPPLELWPHTYSKNNPQGAPLPNNPNVIKQYDTLYKKLLAEKFDPREKEYSNLPTATCWLQYAPWSKAMPDEAKRYDAMKPLRDFVMGHYRIVGHYGMHVLFEYVGKPDSGAQ